MAKTNSIFRIMPATKASTWRLLLLSAGIHTAPYHTCSRGGGQSGWRWKFLFIEKPKLSGIFVLRLGLDLTSLPTLCTCMVSAVWHETSSQCSSLQQGVKLVRKCKTISNSIYTLLCYVTKYSKRLFSTIQAENQKLLCENCFLLVNNNTMKFN